MEIVNVGAGFIELVSTFFGSFDPAHNIIQFGLIFLTVIGSISMFFKFFSKGGF